MKTPSAPRGQRSRSPRVPLPLRRARRAATPFNAFIAYADIAAARGAMAEIERVLTASGHRLALVPMLWRFDQLGQSGWRDHSLAEAARASVIVLASSKSHDFSEPLESWVGALLANRQGQQVTVVALLGPNDAWTITIESSRQISATCPRDAAITASAGMAGTACHSTRGDVRAA